MAGTLMLIKLLCKIFPYKEIGWKDVGETFYRFSLAKTPWFNIYFHSLDSPNTHEECHDHPWSFIAFIIWPGYLEFNSGTWKRIWPGQILFRPATWQHKVATPFGTSWSIIITGPRTREWGFTHCKP